MSDAGREQAVGEHECDRDVVEQTPGFGHCVVRCPVCERAGIRTWRNGVPQTTWVWEIKAREEAQDA